VPVAAPVPGVDWIGLYLEEDLGTVGVDLAARDITSAPIFLPTHRSRARLVARERAYLSGAAHAQEVFRRLGVASPKCMNDGQWVEAGAEILLLDGPTRGILAAERTALNLVARMSGIATATQELARRLDEAGLPAKVAGTRKTTPGFRFFEKEALRTGGGEAHRMGLFDEAMVKDNHREACGGDVAAAVRKVKAANPGKTVTCEVESLKDAQAAAKAGAHWLLIDNQDPATAKRWAEAVWKVWPQVKVEVSGGITPTNLLDYGWAHRISMGWLTQKVPAKDFSLEWVENLEAKE